MLFRKTARAAFTTTVASVFCFVAISVARSASVGEWSRTCQAPNWQTGAISPVPDFNIDDPSASYWGFTSRLPWGGWETRYNLARINTPLSTEAVLKFLFYHECAHARFNTADEGVADCEGLRAMKADIGLHQSEVDQIRQAYASAGRPFPSGPCTVTPQD